MVSDARCDMHRACRDAVCVGAWQEGFEEEAVLPLARMVYGEVGQSYVALARPEAATLVGKLTNVLKFTVKEIDPTTGAHVFSCCCPCTEQQLAMHSCST